MITSFNKFHVILVCLLLWVVTINGQEKGNGIDYPKHWFISVGQGINVYYGEDDRNADFSERLGTALDLSIGRSFSPLWSIRFQYSGLTAKGVRNYTGGEYIDEQSFDSKYYREYFNLMHLHTDVMLNISNWFGGYKPDRTYEAIPFAGIGFAHSWKNSSNNSTPTFTAGLINNFQLVPSLDLNVELRGMLVFNDKFDGVETNSKKEGMASATIGFTYRFNQKNSSHKKNIKIQEGSSSGPALGSIEMTEAEITSEKIRRLEKALETRDAEINRISKELQQLRDNQITRLETDTVDLAIFFRIGKSELSETDLINLKYLSEKIKHSKFKYHVIGFADSATGTPSRNQYLSEQRAKTVYNTLVQRFGVPEDKLVFIGEGSTHELFTETELNRVVLIQPILKE